MTNDLPDDLPLYVVNTEAFVWHDGRYLMMVRGASEEIAPGALTPPGGKVEATGGEQDILEATVRREVREEVGVELSEVAYVESHAFEGMFGGKPIVVIDLVFLCRYASGEPKAMDADEVAGIEWRTVEELRADARVLPFTLASLELVDRERVSRGWA